MMKLIRLEWKKNNILKFVRNAAIMTAVIALLILPMAGELQRDEIDASYLYGKGIVGTTVELFVDIAYIVFTAIMLASFIVSAYTKKTMHLMFSYPIKRRKILLSQMAAVWIFNMTAMIASKLLIYAILLLSSPVLGISMAEILWIAVFLARSSDPLGGDGEYNLHLIAGGSEDEILQGDDRDGCYPCPLHAGKRRNGQSGQQHSVFCGIVRAVGSVGVSVRFQCGDKGPAVGPGWALTKKCRKITDTGCANYFFD